MLNSELFSTLLGRPLIANPNVAAVYNGMEMKPAYIVFRGSTRQKM